MWEEIIAKQEGEEHKVVNQPLHTARLRQLVSPLLEFGGKRTELGINHRCVFRRLVV